MTEGPACRLSPSQDSHAILGSRSLQLLKNRFHTLRLTLELSRRALVPRVDHELSITTRVASAGVGWGIIEWDHCWTHLGLLSSRINIHIIDVESIWRKPFMIGGAIKYPHPNCVGKFELKYVNRVSELLTFSFE